jgi:hypothetical protein
MQKLFLKENKLVKNIKYLFQYLINRYNAGSNNMNNKNKIVNLGYKLATIILQLSSLLLLNIYVYIY